MIRTKIAMLSAENTLKVVQHSFSASLVKSFSLCVFKMPTQAQSLCVR